MVTSLEDDRLIASMYRREARASLIALALGCGVAMLMCMVGFWWARGYGLPLALAGSAGTLAGLLAYSLYPRPTWNPAAPGRAVADLEPRGATSFARQWVFVLPLASATTLLLGLLLAGIFSSTDEKGLHRAFQRRSLSGWAVENGQVTDLQYNLSSTSPFPGWYYGVPIMIGTILVISIVFWSLRRIATAPRPPSAELFGADTYLRSLRTAFVMAASSSALAFHIAGLAAVTGSVLGSSYMDPVPTADPAIAPGTVPIEPGHTLALVLILASMVVAVAAVVLLARAITVSTEMQARARRGAEPQGVPTR